jgi:multidrug efflux pump subunit AcrA (membrane-fusion protein)
MNRRDKNLLATGILVGVALAAVLYGARQYVTARAKTEALPQTGTATVTAPEPQEQQPLSDSQVAIALTPQEQQSIGVETTEVKRQTVRKEILAPGKVVEPETGVGTISARISGRIEKLFLNVTGESVSQGQPVASIYSPDLFASAEEYKLALENRQRLNASKESQAITQADELIHASQRRLELWGLTPEQIDAIPSAVPPAVQVAIYSSIAGVVTKRNVAEGQYVKEGDILFTVTDLSTVWVQADVFESDIPAVSSGMDARIISPALAGGTLRGTINFLQPSVDPQTRTMTARIQVSNPGMRLRPGMFVQVSLNAPLASDTVAVPRSAVLSTGKEQVVYIAKDNGVFEKRSIEGEAVGDEFYSVTKGLRPGERVVTKGNFLIDSQTRLTGNITGMFGGSKAFGSEAQSTQTPSQNYTVTLRPESSPPKGGSDGMFHVTVAGPDGKSVSDAQVRVTLVMPAMPSMGMGEMRSSINLIWNGSEYSGSGPIAMAGSWNITVEASRNGQILGVYRSRFDVK